jgi:hypothetical protein
MKTFQFHGACNFIVVLVDPCPCHQVICPTNAYTAFHIGVYMDWANPVDPAKSIQSNPKKWVGSDNWVDMSLKNEKPTQKIGFQAKPYPTQKIH